MVIYYLVTTSKNGLNNISFQPISRTFIYLLYSYNLIEERRGAFEVMVYRVVDYFLCVCQEYTRLVIITTITIIIIIIIIIIIKIMFFVACGASFLLKY